MTPNGALAYILNSMAWSAVGAGLTLATVKKRGELIVRRIQPLTWVAIFILLFTAVTAVLSVQSDLRQRRFAECQAQINDQYRTALQRRTQANDEDRTALDKLIFTIASSTTDRSVGRKAINEYVTTRRQNDLQRQKNPIPPIEATCERK